MFTLLDCGYQYIHPNGIEINRPNGAGNYAFVFFKTPARTLLDNKMVSVPPNTCILYSPDTTQLYCHEKAPFVNDWLHFEGFEVRAFLENMDFPLDTPIPIRDPSLISRRILELSMTLRQRGPHASEIICADLKGLLFRIKDSHDFFKSIKKHQNYYRQFIILRNEIYNRPLISHSIEDLSNKISLSKSYFQHIYKELFGVSVKQDIICSRIDHAKHHLRTGAHSVAEVSRICGYENEPHFIRQFKKHVGVTPGKYYSNTLYYSRPHDPENKVKRRQ